MKPLHPILLTLLLLQGVTVLAQKQDSVSTKSKTRQRIDSTTNVQKQKAKEGIKSEVKEVKETVKQEVNSLKMDSIRRQEVKRSTKETSTKILEEKANNLQYDSDNPDDAPWKKEQFSKDDLKKFDLPSKDNAKVPESVGGKQGEYEGKAADVKNLSADEDQLKGKSKTYDNARHKTDSVLAVKEQMEGVKNAGDAMAVQRVYSQKYIQKIRDSLGLAKADSILGIATTVAQASSKEELISKLNTPLKEQTGKAGLGFDEKNQSLTSEDANKLQGLPGQFSNLDLMQLPPEVLSELAPLKGRVTDSKYVKYVDSLRQIYLKSKGYKLDEEQLTEEMKKTAMEKKPKFMDKVNFELILGFTQDSAFTIFQVSPAWAYHFTPHISLGAGPNISVRFHEKKINGLIGIRTFIKGEVWKQRAYVQVEDNMVPTVINQESLARTPHSVLVGGGGILPISKKFGLNLALFYRINQEQVRPGGSPWVVRIGLSNMKDIGKK